MIPLLLSLAVGCYVREPVELAVPNAFNCHDLHYFGGQPEPPPGDFGWKVCRYLSGPLWLDCSAFAGNPPVGSVYYEVTP